MKASSHSRPRPAYRHSRLTFSTAALLSLTVLSSASLSAASLEADLANSETLQLAAYQVSGAPTAQIDSTALKTDARILETPRSVTLIDAARINDQNLQTGDDALSWIPGFNANAGSYHFFARGFRMAGSDWKVDGFSGRIPNGSYAPNLFGYEQLVALKGPAGLLYGASSAPGGQINLVTKKPRAERSTTLTARATTFDGSETHLGETIGTRLELDSTGALTRDARHLYRFLTALEDPRTRPAFDDDNQFYRLSTTHLIFDLSLTPMIEWSRETRATRSSALSPSSSRTVNDGRTDFTLADATPSDVNLAAGSRTDDNLTAGLDLALQSTPRWKTDFALRYHERDYTNDAFAVQTATLTQTNPADPRSWTVARRHTRARTDYENLSADLHTHFEFLNTSHLQSSILLGANARRNETQAYTSTNGADQSPINIYTGIATSPLVADASTNLPRANLTRTTEWNAYAQSQTKLRQKLIATLSLSAVGDNTRTTTPANVTTAITRDDVLTPNLGLVYLLNNKVSLYASRSTSYTLPDATYEDSLGRTGEFSPIEGDNLEAGVKAELWGDLLAASLSIFETELNAILVQSDTNDLNPNSNRYYRQLDAGRRSRGTELEFALAPVKNWQTTFTYTYLDAHDRTPAGTRAGRAPMTPRHAATVFSRYAIMTGPLQNWSVQLGFLWNDTRIGGQSALSATNPDPLRLPAFHRIDLGLTRRWENWTLALNTENLTNRDYLLGGSTGLNLERANPRSYTLRLTRTW